MLKISQLHGFNAAAPSSPYPRVTYDGTAIGTDSDGTSLGPANLDFSSAIMDCCVLIVGFGSNANITFTTVTLNSNAADGSLTLYDNNDADRAGVGIFWWFNPALINPNPLTITTSGNWSALARKVIGLTGVNQSSPTVVTASSSTNGNVTKSISLNTATGGNTARTTIIGARALARGVTGVSQSPGAGVTEIAEISNLNDVTLAIGSMEGVSPGTISFETTTTATALGDAMIGVAFKS